MLVELTVPEAWIIQEKCRDASKQGLPWSEWQDEWGRVLWLKVFNVIIQDKTLQVDLDERELTRIAAQVSIKDMFGSPPNIIAVGFMLLKKVGAALLLIDQERLITETIANVYNEGGDEYGERDQDSRGSDGSNGASVGA
jgi:hypothetical protein